MINIKSLSILFIIISLSNKIHAKNVDDYITECSSLSIETCGKVANCYSSVGRDCCGSTQFECIKMARDICTFSSNALTWCSQGQNERYFEYQTNNINCLPDGNNYFLPNNKKCSDVKCPSGFKCKDMKSKIKCHGSNSTCCNFKSKCMLTNIINVSKDLNSNSAVETPSSTSGKPRFTIQPIAVKNDTTTLPIIITGAPITLSTSGVYLPPIPSTTAKPTPPPTSPVIAPTAKPTPPPTSPAIAPTAKPTPAPDATTGTTGSTVPPVSPTATTGGSTIPIGKKTTGSTGSTAPVAATTGSTIPVVITTESTVPPVATTGSTVPPAATTGSTVPPVATTTSSTVPVATTGSAVPPESTTDAPIPVATSDASTTGEEGLTTITPTATTGVDTPYPTTGQTDVTTGTTTADSSPPTNDETLQSWFTSPSAYRPKFGDIE